MERGLRRVRASGSGAVTMERGARYAALAVLTLVALLSLAYNLRGPVSPMPPLAAEVGRMDVGLMEPDLTL